MKDLISKIAKAHVDSKSAIQNLIPGVETTDYEHAVFIEIISGLYKLPPVCPICDEDGVEVELRPCTKCADDVPLDEIEKTLERRAQEMVKAEIARITLTAKMVKMLEKQNNT